MAPERVVECNLSLSVAYLSLLVRPCFGGFCFIGVMHFHLFVSGMTVLKQLFMP
jgi:hypothetical protein